MPGVPGVPGAFAPRAARLAPEAMEPLGPWWPTPRLHLPGGREPRRPAMPCRAKAVSRDFFRGPGTEDRGPGLPAGLVPATEGSLRASCLAVRGTRVYPRDRAPMEWRKCFPHLSCAGSSAGPLRSGGHHSHRLSHSGRSLETRPRAPKQPTGRPAPRYYPIGRLFQVAERADSVFAMHTYRLLQWSVIGA